MKPHVQRFRTWIEQAWQVPLAHGSIRHVLSLWYIGTLAVILCGFSLALYVVVATSLSQQLDRQLVSQADRVADAVFAFWRAERTAALSGPGNWKDAPPQTFREAVDRGRFVELAARWAQATGRLDGGSPVQLVNRDGLPVAASPSFSDEGIPVSRPLVTAALGGHTVYETVKQPRRRRRVVTRPVILEGEVLYLVRVGASLEPMRESFMRLGLWLLVLVPGTLAVTSTVGWFLANQAMRPVGEMVAQARQISAQRLDERVHVPQTHDELEQLAVTFNGMLARLEQAFHRLRQFSAAASHELRTPLTVMKGELEVALRHPRDLEEYQRVLRVHLDATEEMVHTTEELLTLAHSEATEGTLTWRPVELGELADHALSTWRTLAAQKAIRLEEQHDGPVWVRGERRLLERVITNLLDNAIRHTPPHGTVTLRVQRHGGEARLVVQDTGSGIPMEELPHLFDRFFKPRAAPEGSHSTGLGLGLCRWIAEVHHGRIEVASRPGQGATFTVWFPLAGPAA